MEIVNIVEWCRTRSRGRRAAAYWGGCAALVVLAVLPFLWFSASAPSSHADAAAGAPGSRGIMVSGIPDTDQEVEVPPGDEEAGGAAIAAPPASFFSPPASPRGLNSGGSGAFAQVDPAPSSRSFDIQCWPATSIVPGRSVNVDCVVPLSGGFQGTIALECRVEEMECEPIPSRVSALSVIRQISVKLRVTAPESASVDTKFVGITATEVGGPITRSTQVKVSVAPPFSVLCESFGATFVQGSEVSVKCWVTFGEGFADDVALTITDNAGASVALDIGTLSPVPNQTRAFNLVIDEESLETGVYNLKVSAESLRYQQQATAVVEILP